MNTFIFFIAIISSTYITNIVQVEATGCIEAHNIIKQTIGKEHLVISSCIGSTDMELEWLESFTLTYNSNNYL
jgi:hypothetical protein